MPIHASMRSRVAIGILAAFLVFTGIAAVTFGYYGYRVYAELSPGSWRAPTEILDRSGKTLVSLYGREWRVAEPVSLGDLPEHVPNAFLAAEDTRFRTHFGIDPVGIGRAALSNVRAGEVTEGGSTITQQLAKTRFLSAERTLTRKAIEAGLAIMIELRLSKDEILEAYLNEVYLGHRDGREVRGIGEAARVYYGKTPAKLTSAEAALIAGMIRAPNRDNPDERSRIAKQRRDAVLGVMLEREWVTRDAHSRAVAADAEFRPGSRRLRPHPYLIAALRQEFVDRIGERRLNSNGLRIFTSVDRGMQVAAEAAVRGGTQRLRGNHRWLRRKKPLQGAILSVEPSTGGIRALVGGSDFRRSQFDRTRRMRRQPGSAAKPFTYAAAIEMRNVTPATIIEDQPVEIRLASNRTWRPKNYDEQFRGPVTVRDAFEKSLNVPAIKVAEQVGVGRVHEVFNSAGFTGELSETPAIALGVDDVSMRELVSAYSIFPNLGVRVEPHLIDSVAPRAGDAIYTHEEQRSEAMDPAVAYVVHSLMRGVVMRGTAASLNNSGLGHIAGKTGTTNNYRDAWFVGYAPDLLTAVWVGFDDGTPLRLSSAEAALPMWSDFMRRSPHSRGEIRPPPGVTLVEVEAMTGRLWEPGCGPSVNEVFLQGTEPRERCGGFYDGSMAMLQFAEPALITEEQWLEWSRDSAAMRGVEVITDPDEMEITEEDTLILSPELDSVGFSNAEEEARQAEERRRRERQRPLPPPVVRRPRVDSAIPPPVRDTSTPPPPPPEDTLVAIRSRQE
ncbi:MAG TPA: PBP1A family penicillin-binding protein [Gemmatimonadaceae bacterium]|nr:PBP1A family penicillin-binding protein [Gemmatimonadaceae bacterium]